MKKIIVILCLVILISPLNVKENIICNDGTISKSCSDCHRGCCSKHGGCSNSSSNSSSNNSSNKKPATPEKVKSSDTSIKSITIDNDKIEISDKMTYSTTKESVKILVIANDSKASLDYSKNPNLNIGDNNINIKVTAEDGKVKNYELNIIREKILSDNKNIKIIVEGKEVVFNDFKSEVINIANDITKLKIEYELEDNNASVSIIGNENLQVGYNEVTLKVTAENGEEQDYKIIVQRDEIKDEVEEEVNEDIKEESPTENNKSTVSEDDSNIFSDFLTLGVVGASGYFIFKHFKNKK